MNRLIEWWAARVRIKQVKKLDGAQRMLFDLECAWEFQIPHNEANRKRYEARKRILTRLIKKFNYNLYGQQESEA